jgi:hypothetical protein
MSLGQVALCSKQDLLLLGLSDEEAKTVLRNILKKEQTQAKLSFNFDELDQLGDEEGDDGDEDE